MLFCSCSKSRLWNLKYEHRKYENGRRAKQCGAFAAIPGPHAGASQTHYGFSQDEGEI